VSGASDPDLRRAPRTSLSARSQMACRNGGHCTPCVAWTPIMCTRGTSALASVSSSWSRGQTMLVRRRRRCPRWPVERALGGRPRRPRIDTRKHDASDPCPPSRSQRCSKSAHARMSTLGEASTGARGGTARRQLVWVEHGVSSSTWSRHRMAICTIGPRPSFPSSKRSRPLNLTQPYSTQMPTTMRFLYFCILNKELH
jgi:hypothetical protein